jgi:hypothetical protein
MNSHPGRSSAVTAARRLSSALGILLLSTVLAELCLAGVRLLAAERQGHPAASARPGDQWTAVRQMGAWARAMGFR